MVRDTMVLIGGAMLLLVLAAPAAAPGRYASVDGLKMYYEVHGTGRPLALLHGGLPSIGPDFGKLIPVLARTRRVIAIEQQGHGHTADVDRPLRYEQMADEAGRVLPRAVAGREEPRAGGPGGLPLAEGVRGGGASAAGLAHAGGECQGARPHLARRPARADPGDPGSLADHHRRRGHRPSGARGRAVPVLLGGGVAGDVVGLPRAQLAVLPGTTHVTLIDR